ncbi:uncharacterized protein PAC_05303 [Phialocephala subalpina]|uniref:Uncharacterized protein n=1 Tax=Phialocephala subalpina TaxID=576137 RepID=A0A1L7WRM2_9HELO|nr:uncharacterized protein PAC_05303 [Phialocephala subalpina]
MDNARDNLALSMWKATVTEPRTRSKKRKDKLRLKRVRLQQEQQRIARELKLAQRKADLDKKPFPFLDLPYGVQHFPSYTTNYCLFVPYAFPQQSTSTDTNLRAGQSNTRFTDINGPTNANNFRNGTMATFQAEKLRKEGTDILYGDNIFSFDVGGQRGEVLEEDPQHIPGLKSAAGGIPSGDEVAAAIERIFDKKSHHPRFIWQDLLLHFFTRIGQYNARLLKSIKLSGEFKTWYETGTLAKIYERSIWTVRWTNIISGGHYEDMDSDLSDQDVLHGIVSELVEGLPHLKQLHLGWSGDFHGKHELGWGVTQSAIEEEKWGHALEWVDIVNNREDAAPSVLDNQNVEETNVDEGHTDAKVPETGEEIDTGGGESMLRSLDYCQYQSAS